MKSTRVLLVAAAVLFAVYLAHAKDISGAAETKSPNVSKETKRKLRKFTEWFHDISPNVNYKVTFNRSDWGVGVFLSQRAREELGETENRREVLRVNDLMMDIPENYTLCDESLKERPYHKIVTADPKLTEEDRVTLILLTEWLLGNKSNLSAWMRVVPTVDELQPPHLWSYEAQNFIEPLSIRNEIRNRARQLKDHYRSLVKNSHAILQKLEVFVRKNGDKKFMSLILSTETVTSLEGLDLFTQRRYLWARALVDTRAWNLQGHKWLVPGADMFNHMPDQEEEEYDHRRVQNLDERSQKFLQYHRIRSLIEKPPADKSKKKGQKKSHKMPVAIRRKVARVYSDRVIYNRAESGTLADPMEVFESYGDNDNNIYFIYHGFIPKQNNYDCQPIWLRLPNKETKRFTEVHKKAMSKIPTMANRQCLFNESNSPALILFGIISHLPTSQLKDSYCIEMALKHPQEGFTTFDAMQHRLDALVECLKKESRHRRITSGLRTAKAIVMMNFKEEFSSSKVGPDLELMAKFQEKVNSGSLTVAQEAEYRQKILALEFRIHRKQILNSVVTSLKDDIAVHVAELGGKQKESHEALDKKKKAEEAKEGKKQKEAAEHRRKLLEEEDKKTQIQDDYLLDPEATVATPDMMGDLGMDVEPDEVFDHGDQAAASGNKDGEGSCAAGGDPDKKQCGSADEKRAKAEQEDDQRYDFKGPPAEEEGGGLSAHQKADDPSVITNEEGEF